MFEHLRLAPHQRRATYDFRGKTLSRPIAAIQAPRSFHHQQRVTLCGGEQAGRIAPCEFRSTGPVQARGRRGVRRISARRFEPCVDRISARSKLQDATAKAGLRKASALSY